MTEEIQDIFDEIRNIMQPDMDHTARYHALDTLLLRALKDRTRHSPVDFTHTAARLHWLCKQTGHPSHPLEVFRARAGRIQKGLFLPNGEDEAYDLKAVCEGLAAFYQTHVPEDVQKRLPRHWRPAPAPAEKVLQAKRIRITVHRWDEHFIYGKDHTHPTEQLLKVEYADETDRTFADLNGQLYEGAQLNLLSVKAIKAEGAYPYVLKPEMLVLDPDFLIDITALCACIKPYGYSAYTHLLNKFAPPARSAAIQLGNAANQFLDDCVNERFIQNADGTTEAELYLRSMQNSFRFSPLAWSTLPDIDRDFFNRCEMQFHHIRQTVRNSFSAAGIDIRQTEVELEPSFLCEALGLQGRMDLLTRNADKLVELKSGKADEYPYHSPKEEHSLQMALYKEILYYNLDRRREQVQSYLFYSRYPGLYAVDVPRSHIRRAMALRNAILHIEHRLRRGESRTLIEELTEERLNVDGRADRLYSRYLRPRMMEILAPLHGMRGVEADYFHRFLTFTAREQFRAKVGDDRADSPGGFAETWCCDTQTKQQNGNILTGLKLHPVPDEEGAVVRLDLQLPEYGEDFLPNFRQGDMVMLYERNHERDNVTNKQFFRCTIEEIHPERMLLKLSYKQRNAEVFRPDSLYAVEPGYMDATFNQAYSGLFSLLTAPRERKELLLGIRPPATDPSVRLHRHHLNEEIDRIVLKAKQARDYFLLVGPPGTGKTSVALKSMVEEFLSDHPQKTLLLMAYTNRAVDEICHTLSAINPAPEYIRIGQELNCAPDFRPRLMKHVIGNATSRKEIYEKLAPVRVFAGTISSLCSQTELFSLKVIDVAIIDEASQVLEPQLLPLLCATTPVNRGDYNLNRLAIGKFILIGDHKQLPAVVSQPREMSRVTEDSLQAIGLTDCRNSLFERLHRLNSLQGTEGIVEMLHRQGRMHPSICEFVNRNYYNGGLDAVPLPHQQKPLAFGIRPDDDRWTAFVAGTRMAFISVQADEAEYYIKSNKREAETVAHLVHTLCQLHSRSGIPFSPCKQIGIIVPFRAQIAMIRKALAERHIPDTTGITIDTVERYQGSQRDIIIFSTTVSRPYQLPILSEPVMTDGRELDRKLNVALTRARKQFFMTGNETLLRKCTAYREFLDFLSKGQILRL
ncbi:DEAD/DEAH box helicase [Paraprevotella xylaniphila]|uniref:DEAD/DEAH box helicase n=1 Tax=Paraprevotella xylaniphila TaxID=454155 RepID=UPI0023F05DCD|nr:AAA domain-containing protein [Paraprevotella xylaniphila]